MITYQKRFGAFNLLFRVYGAPWPRAVILAIPSTLAVIFLVLYGKDAMKDVFSNATGFTSYAGLVTFFLTFRTTLSYQRYMECVTSIKTMTTKWADCALQLVVALEIKQQNSKDSGSEKVDIKLKTQILHLLSLMHALALMDLRGDQQLTNLKDAGFMEEEEEPSTDAASNKYWMTKRRKRSLFFITRDQTHFEDYFNSNPLTVLGGVSTPARNQLQQSRDRVHLVNSWIARIIGYYVDKRCGGSLPPAMARVFFVLGDGMSGYENAMKNVETPFPFPFAQSAAILLNILTIISPFMLQKSGPVWISALINFLFIFGANLLNEVAQEIEEPFKYDPNDLPLQWYQYGFNKHLLTAYVKGMVPEGPDALLDHLGGEDTMLKMLALNKPNLRASTVSVQVENGKESTKPPAPAVPPVEPVGPLVRTLDEDSDEDDEDTN